MALRCSSCEKDKSPSEFNDAHTTSRGKQYKCRQCQRTYYQDYILPALRGRGRDHVLPQWALSVLRGGRPFYPPAKVLRLLRNEVPPRAVVTFEKRPTAMH